MIAKPPRYDDPPGQAGGVRRANTCAVTAEVDTEHCERIKIVRINKKIITNLNMSRKRTINGNISVNLRGQAREYIFLQ